MPTSIALIRPQEEIQFDADCGCEIVVKDKRVFARRISVDCSGMKCVTFFGLEGQQLVVSRVGDSKCGTFYVPYPCGKPWLITEEGCSKLFSKPGLYEIRDSEGEALPEGMYVEMSTVSPDWAATLLFEECFS